MNKQITAILNFIKKYKRIELLSDLLKGGGGLFILVSCFLLVWLAFDNGLHLSMEWRIIGFILLTASLIPPGKSFKKKLHKTLKTDNLALRLEQQNGHNENRIVNALCYCRKGPSSLSTLEKEIIAESGILLSTFSPFRNLKKVFSFKNILAVALLASFLLSYLLLAPDFFINGTLRLFLPVFSIPPLTRVVLEGDFKNQDVALGESLNLRFRVSKGESPFARLLITKEEGGSLQEQILFPDEKGEFHHTFSNIRKSFSWVLKAADYETPRYQVTLLNPPQITDSILHILPPFYITSRFEPAPLQTTHNIPEKSEVKIMLELDSDIQNLTMINLLKPEELAFKKMNARQWEIVFPLTEPKIFKIFFKSNTHEFKPLDTQYHLNIIKDTPPSIRLQTPPLVLLEPEVLKTEISFFAEDDYGIHSYELQYKQDKDWHTYETKEIEERKTLEKYWLIHLDRLKYLPSAPLYFRIIVEDLSPSKTFSPLIRVTPMNGFDFRLNVFRQFIEINDQLSKFLTSAYLNNSWDSNTFEEIQNLLQKILTLRRKNYQESIPSLDLFLPLEKLESLVELSSKPNKNKVQKDRLKEELITFSSNFMKEKVSLLNILLKKNLQDFQKEILMHKNSSLSSQKQKSLKPLSVYWNQFTRSLQENRESFHQMHFKPLYMTFDRFIKASEKSDIAQRCTLLEKALTAKEDENILSGYKKLYEEVERFMNSFYMKGHQKNEWDEKRIRMEVQSLAEEMKKTLSLLNLIDLKKLHEPSDFEMISGNTLSLINKFREKISELQDLYPQLGIKGLTLLNEVQYNLKETKSWYINDSSSKAEVKMKKAAENLALCIEMLNSLFKSGDTAKIRLLDMSGEKTELGALKPAVFLFKPDPLTSATGESTVDIEGTASAPHGISEILLEASLFDSDRNKQASFQKIILSPVHLPQKTNFKYPLDLSLFPLNDKGMLEFKILCKEESGSETLIGESPTCQILINNTPSAIYSAETPGLMNSIEQAWRLLTESQAKAVELFKSYEKEWLDRNTKAIPPLSDQIRILETMILNKLSALEKTLKQFKLNPDKGTDDRVFSQIFTLRLEVFREIKALLLSLNQQSLMLANPESDPLLFNASLIRSKNHILNALLILQSLVLEKDIPTLFPDSLEWMEETLQKFRDISHEKNFSSPDSLVRQSLTLLDSLEAGSQNISPGLKTNLTTFIQRWKKILHPGNIPTAEAFQDNLDLLTRELSLMAKASFRQETQSTLHHQASALNSTNAIADLYSILQKASLPLPQQTLIDSLLSPDNQPLKKDPEILKKQIKNLLDEEKDLPLPERMNLMTDKLEILKSRYEKLSGDALELKDILFFKKLNDTLSFLENQAKAFDSESLTSDPFLLEIKKRISGSFEKLLEMQNAIEEKISSGIEAYAASNKLPAKEHYQSLLSSSEPVQTGDAGNLLFQKNCGDLNSWLQSFASSDSSESYPSDQISVFYDLLKKIIPHLQLISDKSRRQALLEASQTLHESLFLFQNALIPPRPFLQNLKTHASASCTRFSALINDFLDQEVFNAFEQNRRQLLSDLGKDIETLQNDKRDLMKNISELEKLSSRDDSKKEDLLKLESRLTSVDEQLQKLDQHKASLSQSEEIRITITPQDKSMLPRETQLLLNKTDNTLQDIESGLNGKQEALTSRILKTISSELENMEDASPASADRKGTAALHHYAASLLETPEAGNIQEKLKEEASKEAFLSQNKSLSSIITQLKDATDSLDKLREGEKIPLQKEEYLSFLNQGITGLTELDNSLKTSQQVSSYFKQKVNQSLNLLKNQYQELEQNALGSDEWKNQILKTSAMTEGMTKDLYANMDSALLRYYHLNLPPKDKKSLEHSTRYDHPYPGYETLIRDYLISIADADKDF